MLINGKRELAYLVKIDGIEPIEGSDNCEAAVVGGWRVMVRKNTFKPNDLAVYFEIDSQLPQCYWSKFLAKKHYKVKTQKYTFGGKGNFISQGLLMLLDDFEDNTGRVPSWVLEVKSQYMTCFAIPGVTVEEITDRIIKKGYPLTETLGVTYSVVEDNKRKSNTNKYMRMKQRNAKLFNKYNILNKIYKNDFGKKVLFLFLGNRRDAKSNGWPVGKFPGVTKTDQERCENMVWVLEDKTPFIVTQKCDGSSGTFILERKRFNKFEFYVCSRNVRMFKPDQKCFYGENNYYWEVALKYNIEEKMKDYLNKNKDINFVCWQGEICGPGIQSNPQALSETHLFLFHMTDSKNGRYDIREAAKIWKEYNMEIVPIIDENYILPDDFEEFKLSADGMYDSSVCEGHNNCEREGFVYYKTTEPTFSFKNVSREYLIKKGQ